MSGRRNHAIQATSPRNRNCTRCSSVSGVTTVPVARPPAPRCRRCPRSPKAQRPRGRRAPPASPARPPPPPRPNPVSYCLPAFTFARCQSRNETVISPLATRPRSSLRNVSICILRVAHAARPARPRSLLTPLPLHLRPTGASRLPRAPARMPPDSSKEAAAAPHLQAHQRDRREDRGGPGAHAQELVRPHRRHPRPRQD